MYIDYGSKCMPKWQMRGLNSIQAKLTLSRNQSPMFCLPSQASRRPLRSWRKDSWWLRICGIWKKMSSASTLLTIWWAESWFFRGR